MLTVGFFFMSNHPGLGSAWFGVEAADWRGCQLE